MKRAPHPTETCDNCRFYFGQIGDRDAKIRDLLRQVEILRHHAEELESIRRLIATADLPDTSPCGWPLTMSGQINYLIRAAAGWQREDL